MLHAKFLPEAQVSLKDCMRKFYVLTSTKTENFSLQTNLGGGGSLSHWCDTNVDGKGHTKGTPELPLG